MVACGGNKHFNKGDEALGLDPEDSPAELYVRMAEEYYARGQVDIAFRRAQQALEADRRYPRAHIWVAFLYEEIGQAERAQQHYDRAVGLAPRNPDVRYAYASFQCRQQQYAEADAQFAKVLESPLYSTPWVAMTNAGDCAASAGDTDKAERYYRDAIAASPSFGPALAKMAELAYKRGDTKTAKRYLDRYFEPQTIRAASTSFLALTIGTQVERKLGNRKRANYYQKVLDANFPEAPPKTRGL